MPMIDVQGAMTIHLGEGDVKIARYNGEEPPFIMFSDNYGRMTTIRSCNDKSWFELKKVIDEVCDQLADSEW